VKRPKLARGERVLRMKWGGGPAAVALLFPGHLLYAERGRRAFRILSIEVRPERTTEEGTFTPLRIVAESVKRATLTETGAVSHLIVWDRAAPKRTRRGRPVNPRPWKG
jgi:hypothetical protein